MEPSLLAAALAIYSMALLQGVARSTIRPCHQLLQDLAKLTALSLLSSLICCTALSALLVGVAGYCLYHNLPTPHLPTQGKAVFITGCDRGLGYLLAIHLDSLGMQVFAGCLFPGREGEKELKSKCSHRLTTVCLDVSKEESVKAAAKIVHSQLQGQALWGVVNNAGILFNGAFEVVPQEDFHRVFDINFMGQVHVIRAFLPMLRQSQGRIVNISSNYGLAPIPFAVAYAASKAAVASLTESLRMELRYFNIHAATIVPSGYKTGILQQFESNAVGDRWWATADKEIQESYGRDSFYPQNKVQNYKSMLNADFSGIIHKMTEALLETSPKDFYYKGLLARSLPFLYLHTPSSIARLFLAPFVTHYKFDPPMMRGKAHGKKD